MEGKLSQCCYLPVLPGIEAERVYLVGCGKKGRKLSREKAINVLSKMVNCAISSKADEASILIPDLKVEEEENNWISQQIAFLCENNVYTYDAKLNKKNKKVIKLKKVNIAVSSKLSSSKISRSLKIGQSIGRGSNVAKDLANLPGNVCTPSYLAKESRAASRKYPSLTCSVLGEKEMKKLGMDCLLSVGAGSVQESKSVSYTHLTLPTTPYV